MEELRCEKEAIDTRAGKTQRLEETIIELRQANRSLEDKLAKLCESPFIADAFKHQENRLKVEDMEKEVGENRSKMDHLQEAVKTHYAALVTLKQQASKLREEKEAAEKLVQELKLRLHEVERGSSDVMGKYSALAAEGGVDMEALERALTMVKRRGETMARLDFLQDPDAIEGHEEGVGGVSTPMGMKRKLQEVQILNVNLTKEAERLESMLKLQTDINKDLHKELEGMIKKTDKDKKEILRRATDFEDLAIKRLHKIHSLEAQIRQLVYGVSHKKGRPLLALDSHNNNDTLTSESAASNALLTELMEEKEGGDVNPDENLLEVWIKGGTIRDVLIPMGTSSFVVIDFFDYESQTTALAAGNKPQWDFAATFKLVVDDFLLRYLATDVLRLELNTVILIFNIYRIGFSYKD